MGMDPQRKQVSKVVTVPAAIGGLNAVDALAAMPPTDAIVMDNFFPEPSYVSLRSGYSKWSTGYPGWVESIFCYANGTGTQLFGLSGTHVYSATTSGPIGAPVVSSLTNARWEYVNVATAGGNFLYAANGVDKPLLYDGAAWVKVDSISTPAITGVTTTLLRNPVTWKNRVWFVEDGSMRAWFLPTASVGGAASSFDFGPLFPLGGSLQVIMTASLTNGSTFDDYIFFMSSQGEILMYAGTDPAQAGVFVIQGRYRVGKPVGRRCWFRYGDDAVVICSDGFVSLSKMIAIGRTSEQNAISYKILNLVNQDVAAYSSNFGWQGVLHPLGNKIVMNVPQSENNVQYQYVMNTITDSWCRFTNWNAATFEVQGNNLYFGGSNYIALADTGQDDSGAAIPGLLKTAFNYFGNDGQKFFKMCRPLVQTNGTIVLSLNLNVDYSDAPPINQGSYVAAAGSPWDTSPWDTSPWTTGLTMQTDWKTVYGIGFTAALYVGVTAAGITVRIQAIDYVWEGGGVL